MHVHLPSWAEVERVAGPEESSRMGTRENAAGGNDTLDQNGSGCLLVAAKRQRGAEAKTEAPWGQASPFALFTAPSCGPWSGPR